MGGLSFLSPLFLLGALAVAILVVLPLSAAATTTWCRSARCGSCIRCERASTPSAAAGSAAARAARGGLAAAGDRVCPAVPAVADIGLGGRCDRGGRRCVGQHGRCDPLCAGTGAGAASGRQGASRRRGCGGAVCRPGRRARGIRARSHRGSRGHRAAAAVVRADPLHAAIRARPRCRRHATRPARVGTDMQSRGWDVADAVV